MYRRNVLKAIFEENLRNLWPQSHNPPPGS
jgi:hypothetical protein